jgi:hypothetical protein
MDGAREDREMSQHHVERVIGKLVTNPDFRRTFALLPEAALQEIIETGLRLTPVEFQALLTVDLEALQRLADRLDPRIQRISFGKSGTC